MITSFFAPKSKRAADEATASASAKSDEDIKRQRVSIPSAIIATKNSSPEVGELLSHLIDTPNNTHTWRQALLRHTSSQSFAALAKFLAADRKSYTVFPPACDVFSALNLTPVQDVKIVIVGQDPYHGPGQAHGLSFSVRKGVKIPASLKNIYKELTDDPNVDFPAGGRMPNHGYLERWAKQGVLMLNSILTVRAGLPNSHGKRGWESFSDEIIRILDRESEASNKGLVFLLWGKPASAKAQAILRRNGRTRHKIICTSHPSPLGATKTDSPFLGSKCFSRANEALTKLGMEPIDWNVDGDLK
jgi:uracil-DNA glycosylase